MVKKIIKNIALIFLILGMLLLSGCDEIDCSKKDTKYTKYKFDEETGECIVYKKIPMNKCGNGIPENGETYCNCPKDVKKTDPKNGCFGTLGEYLEKKCDKFTKKCILVENKKVITKNKEISFKNSDLYLKADLTYKYPLIININEENKIKIQLNLFKFMSNSRQYENILIKKLYIENLKGEKLGSVEYNEQVNNPGDKLPIKEIKLSDTDKYHTKTTLKFKIDLSYTIKYLNTKGEIIKTENKIETLTTSLSGFEIINPNFYEKNKK